MFQLSVDLTCLWFMSHLEVLIRHFWLDTNIYILVYNIMCAFVVGLNNHIIVNRYTTIKHFCLLVKSIIRTIHS